MAVDKFPIEAGHIMLFARSIGDANPSITTRSTRRKPKLVQ